MAFADLNFWKNKKVFLTGHTGFKGSWLTLFLSQLGAEVHGYSLTPPTQPSLFELAKIKELTSSHTIGDIRNFELLQTALKKSQPDIVFHLAAQALVLNSYRDPVRTYSTNVLGTVHLLEGVRNIDSARAVVNVTSDKCYENLETGEHYREDHRLGGADPYSSSKACSELVTAAYRNSFFQKTTTAVASARAGNVIGGGDWAEDRLIPDFLRTIETKVPLVVRSPNSVRPWQHVLEPVLGYVLLAEKLFQEGSEFAESFNFGPDEESAQSVSWILNSLQKLIPSAKWKYEEQAKFHEAKILMLDSTKAKKNLKWKPRWNLETAILKTVDFHNSWMNKEDIQQVAIKQLREFERIRLT